MNLTLQIRDAGGDRLAEVSTLENGTTLVIYPYGSTCLHCELHELFSKLVEEHGEIHVTVRRRVVR